MTPPIEARCDVCSKLSRKSELTLKGEWLLCDACPQPALPPSAFKLPPGPPKYDRKDPTTWKRARCEGCFQVRLVSWMGTVGDKHLCAGCRLPKPEFSWFGISVYGADGKVRAAVRQRLLDRGFKGRFKRVIVPKRQEGRRTLDRYDVYDTEGSHVGQVSAEDAGEALHKAKDQFNKPKKKTVYHPEHELDARLQDAMAALEADGTDPATGFPVFKVVSDQGRTMARITEPTVEKAQATAARLYGTSALDKMRARAGGPQAGKKLTYTEVKEVKLAKAGGKQVFGDKRAMPGYLLIECEADDRLFQEIKETPGVSAVLPWREKVTFDDLEDEDYVPRTPVAIEGRVADAFVGKPQPAGPVSLDFKAGDLVRVVDGPYKGQEVTVTEVCGSPANPQIKAQVVIFGRPTPYTFDYTLVRKV